MLEGANFVQSVRALGGEPASGHTKFQVGVRGTVKGALIIDGAPLSPATPRWLPNLQRPTEGPTRADIATFHQAVTHRAKFAMVHQGKRNANRSQDFNIPAAAGKLNYPSTPAAPHRAAKPCWS
jgi:hypothetical protein